MSTEDLPVPERILLMMHNLGAVHGRASKTIQELVHMTKISLEQLADILKKHEEDGYIQSLTDPDGAKRYFLTGRGIIRVSSAYT